MTNMNFINFRIIIDKLIHFDMNSGTIIYYIIILSRINIAITLKINYLFFKNKLLFLFSKLNDNYELIYSLKRKIKY